MDLFFLLLLTFDWKTKFNKHCFFLYIHNLCALCNLYSSVYLLKTRTWFESFIHILSQFYYLKLLLVLVVNDYNQLMMQAWGECHRPSATIDCDNSLTVVLRKSFPFPLDARYKTHKSNYRSPPPPRASITRRAAQLQCVISIYMIHTQNALMLNEYCALYVSRDSICLMFSSMSSIAWCAIMTSFTMDLYLWCDRLRNIVIHRWHFLLLCMLHHYI